MLFYLMLVHNGLNEMFQQTNQGIYQELEIILRKKIEFERERSCKR